MIGDMRDIEGVGWYEEPEKPRDDPYDYDLPEAEIFQPGPDTPVLDGDSPGEFISAHEIEIEDQSLKDTVDAWAKWAFDESVKHLANAVHPGLGVVVDVWEKVAEVWDTLKAVDEPEEPQVVEVPAFHVADLDIGLHIRLPGSGGAKPSGPPVNVFFAPGDGGMFGGWAIEQADAEPASPEAAGGPAAAQMADRDADEPERAGSADPGVRRVRDGGGALISMGLPAPPPGTDSDQWAAALCLAASQLSGEQDTGRPFADPEADLVVAYDPRAGCGLWARRSQEPSSSMDSWMAPERGRERIIPGAPARRTAASRTWRLIITLDSPERRMEVSVSPEFWACEDWKPGGHRFTIHSSECPYSSREADMTGEWIQDRHWHGPFSSIREAEEAIGRAAALRRCACCD
jgi:hypothetical protein